MSRRRRGRPYAPLPPSRRNVWLARLLVLGVGLSLLIGTLAYAVSQ